MRGSVVIAAVEPVVPGYLAEATVAPGFAGAFRISKHGGAIQRSLRTGEQELIVAAAQTR